MRKFGLLATLTLALSLAFASTAFAAPTADPGSTDPAAQAFTTNGTGVGTEGEPGFSGQDYRMTPDADGFDKGNAGTGFDSPANLEEPIKYDSPNNKVIHSAYSKTSDACASCHAIHTAVSNMLLQWEDPQTACWACHDGTVAATYDVVNGTHSGVMSSGGLFGLGTEAATAGLSNHGMSPKETAFVTTAAAPGGSENATTGVDTWGQDVANVDKNGNWNTEFVCIACHDPHGTYGNARILNPDVNGIASKTLADLTTAKGAATTTTDNLTYTTATKNWMNGRNQEPVVYVDGTKVTTGYSVTSYKDATIKFDTAQTGVVKIAYKPALVVNMTVANKLTNTETVKYQNGINEFCGACHTDYNNVNKVPVWKTTDGLDTATSGNNKIIVKDVDGKPVQATNADGSLKFKSGGAYNEMLGDYRQAYRHSVGFGRTNNSADPTFADPNSLNASYKGLKFDTSNPQGNAANKTATVDCLTCHYAHGTSDAFIETSLNQLGITDFNGINAAGDTILQTYDTSRTTALKRLPNMGVCQVCHNKTGVAPN